MFSQAFTSHSPTATADSIYRQTQRRSKFKHNKRTVTDTQTHTHSTPLKQAHTQTHTGTQSVRRKQLTISISRQSANREDTAATKLCITHKSRIIIVLPSKQIR